MTLSAESATCSTTGVTEGTCTVIGCAGTTALAGAGRGKFGTGTVTTGAEGLGPTEVATDAAAFLTAPVAALRVLLVCLLTLSADGTADDTEDGAS